MHGAELHFREYRAPTEDWDHAHCSLCWTKLTDLSEGYVLEDDMPRPVRPVDERTTYDEELRVVASPTKEEWICQTCFDDFRDYFGWRVVN